MKLLGQTKERKTTLTMGLRIVMTKSLQTLRMTTLIERVLRALPEPGGGSNKYTFSKVSQIVFSQGFATSNRKCEMHVFSQAFANMFSQ